MATRSEVVDLLNMFKGCVELGLWYVKDREKNRQGLIDLNMTPNQRKNVLLSLTPECYCAGPQPDDTDEAKDIWVFGIQIENVEIYIKLRVLEDSRRKNTWRAMVWSFHQTEHTMKYPLRGGGT